MKIFVVVAEVFKKKEKKSYFHPFIGYFSHINKSKEILLNLGMKC
jgi:hypothetical protein